MIKQCSQDKCGFLKAGMGCRKCKECNSAPFMVEEDACSLCWNCSHDEGVLRWDNNQLINQDQLIQVIEHDTHRERIRRI